jgi:hypothetical protein
MFYQDVQKGPPSSGSCDSSIKRLVNETMGLLSGGLIVSGLLYFCAFNAQYGLWRRRFTRDPPVGGAKSGKKEDRSKNYMVE